MKKVLFLVSLLSCVIFSAAFLPCTTAHAQKAIEWRALHSFTADFLSVVNLTVPLFQKINERAAGKLKISWVGSEAVPAFQQLKPLREGLFDLLYTHPAFHAGDMALGQGMDLVTATAKERREAGMLKIVDEAYRKRMNASYLGMGVYGTGYHLVLKKKIEKADLSGLKIRTNPFYDPLVKALGGAPVAIPSGEIYTALEKGVVDGSCFPVAGILVLKLNEVAKYMIRPAFGDGIQCILANLDSWNRLPKDLQELVMKCVIEEEEEGRARMIKAYEKEEKELLKLGMEIATLPSQEAQKFINTFYERSWAELVVQRDPEFGPKLKEAADRIRKK